MKANTPIMVEAKAIHADIKLGLMLNRNIIIETDSKTMANICNDKGEIPWNIRLKVTKITQLIKEEKGKMKIQHILREANGITDLLAKQARELTTPIFENCCKSKCRQILVTK